MAYSARRLVLLEIKRLEGLGERTSEFVQSLILVHRHSHMHMLSEGLGEPWIHPGPPPGASIWLLAPLNSRRDTHSSISKHRNLIISFLFFISWKWFAKILWYIWRFYERNFVFTFQYSFCSVPSFKTSFYKFCSSLIRRNHNSAIKLNIPFLFYVLQPLQKHVRRNSKIQTGLFYWKVFSIFRYKVILIVFNNKDGFFKKPIYHSILL